MLTDLILRRKIAVIVLRGGLGNQLYQISALAFYCRKFSLRPYIFDFDLKMNARDDFELVYRKLNIDSWFEQPGLPSSLHVLKGIEELLIRVALKLDKRFFWINFLGENELQNLIQNNSRITWIRDSFQDKKYPLSLPENFHVDFFPAEHYSLEKRISDASALHVRLTDFLRENPFEAHYYEGALSALARYELFRIDIFSDDVTHCQQLLKIPLCFKVHWPEEASSMRSDEILFRLSNYDTIVASKSSLCWWGAFISWKRNPEILLVHPWAIVENFKDSI